MISDESNKKNSTSIYLDVIQVTALLQYCIFVERIIGNLILIKSIMCSSSSIDTKLVIEKSRVELSVRTSCLPPLYIPDGIIRSIPVSTDAVLDCYMATCTDHCIICILF